MFSSQHFVLGLFLFPIRMGLGRLRALDRGRAVERAGGLHSCSGIFSSCSGLGHGVLVSQPCYRTCNTRASVARLRRVSVRVKEMFVCSDLSILPGVQQILNKSQLIMPISKQ